MVQEEMLDNIKTGRNGFETVMVVVLKIILTVVIKLSYFTN